MGNEARVRRVLVLCEDEYDDAVRHLAQSVRDLGMEVKVEEEKDLLLDVGGESSSAEDSPWKGADRRSPTVHAQDLALLIPSLRSESALLSRATQLELEGWRVVNTPEATRRGLDPMGSLQVLAAARVPVVETHLVGVPVRLARLTRERPPSSFSIILSSRSIAAGAYLAATPEEAQTAAVTAWRPGLDLIVQVHPPCPGPAQASSILVQGGQAIAARPLTIHPHQYRDWRKPPSAGGAAPPPSGHARIAEEGCRVLNLDVAAVELFLLDGSPRVHRVHPFPPQSSWDMPLAPVILGAGQ